MRATLNIARMCWRFAESITKNENGKNNGSEQARAARANERK